MQYTKGFDFFPLPVKRFHSRDSREEKKVRKDLYQPKSTEKGHSSGSEYSSTKKSRAYRNINPVHFSKELNNDDFYITENDEPREKPNIVEMRNFEEGNEFVGEDKEPIAKQAQNLDEGVEAVQKFSRGPLRHLLQFGNKENSSLDYRLGVRLYIRDSYLLFQRWYLLSKSAHFLSFACMAYFSYYKSIQR